MSHQKPTTYASVISQALHQKWKLWGLPEYFFDLKKNRRLQYTQYYGDGDSKAFMSVKDTYELNSVTKFECIGHVQKRVGSRLRKLKTKTKGLSGKGKLTDNFIDRLQNYYGIAVRSNVGNLNAMQQNAIAALYHCASKTHKDIKYAFTGKIQVNSKNFRRKCSVTLTKLTNGKNLSSRIIRWAIKLSEFSIEWEYRPGVQNVVANVLSRNPVSNMDGSQTSCAALRALALNSREQLIREKKEKS
ncbi:uncharacterized protein TNCV_3340271 [Trichonephila clavipes]|nr:uncharacterized protein TNCV_3340271 [Trichonephila clavipes]